MHAHVYRDSQKYTKPQFGSYYTTYCMFEVKWIVMNFYLSMMEHGHIRRLE